MVTRLIYCIMEHRNRRRHAVRASVTNPRQQDAVHRAWKNCSELPIWFCYKGKRYAGTAFVKEFSFHSSPGAGSFRGTFVFARKLKRIQK